MAKNINKELKKQKSFSYLQKDFNSFRQELTNYARQHYSDKLIDFSESSLAGMFLDVAAYVGDSLSYYLDHQFNELFINTAVQSENIDNLARIAGVTETGPSASQAIIEITMTVPAIQVNGQFVPNTDILPIIQNGSIFSSNSGVNFYLLDDVDFSEVDSNDEIKATVVDSILDNSGNVVSFEIMKEGVVSSDKISTEAFSIDNSFIPFRKITLTESNITEIISIIDVEGDEYYQVASLTQDTVYKRFDNSRDDSDMVKSRIQLVQAPKRFIVSRSTATGRTTIRFGSGKDDQFDEDIIPDPSLHALTLYGDRKTFSTINIDPNDILKTSTLGISPRNTTLTVTYRSGGGLADNVPSRSIKNVVVLKTKFPSNALFDISSNIRDSVSVLNQLPSRGGENPLTTQEIKSLVSLSQNSQGRIVTREDLIARVYTMPSNFGRVFRASVADNPNNPFAAQLFILSRDATNQLVVSPDTLKENLASYLTMHKLITDSIDIVDARIINIGLDYVVSIKKNFKSDLVINQINGRLKDYFKIENYQIDQPIITGEVENIIINSPGVQSIIEIKYKNLSNITEGNVYSSVNFSISRNIDRGIIFPTRGGIFEVKYPKDDIKGSVG